MTGGLNEKFYFDKKNAMHGFCQKFASNGNLKTTWFFKNGVLIKRTDFFKEYNIKNKATIEERHAKIEEYNKSLKLDPNNIHLLHSRAITRHSLDDNLLAEFDFLFLKTYYENYKKTLSKQGKVIPDILSKVTASIYGHIAGIYAQYGNDELALEYISMAHKMLPEEPYFYYALGAHLANNQDYLLAIYNLNEVERRFHNHNFAHWSLGYCYLELEQYDQALEHINIAFTNEDNIYSNGQGTSEYDLRTIRGFAYYKLGKTQLGIADLKEALVINDKNSVANKFLGIIYDDLCEPQKACEYFQKSKDLQYEKKFYYKEIDSFIQKSCGVNLKQ